MTQPTRYRKKPVVIEAMQWTGDNAEALAQWAGPLFSVVMPEDAISDPEVTAEIYDRLHSTWVGVKTNDYIIKGVVGEFYPCNGDVFHSTYEEETVFADEIRPLTSSEIRERRTHG